VVDDRALVAARQKVVRLITTRRAFLRSGLALGAGSLAARIVPARAAGGEAVLSAVEGRDPEKIVRRAFDLLGGLGRFVNPGDRVVVKPNASFANPADWGNNTNPAVLRAVCGLAREAGARKVAVVDYPLMRGAEAPALNGIGKVCAELDGVELEVLARREEFRKLAVPGAAVLHEVEIARAVLDADVLINLPVAKAHDAVAASIGLKNLMGVIWDRTAFHTMMEINQAIADLALAIRPRLTLVDMTRVMTTNGPKGPGEVATPGLVVAAVDPVAADSYALGRVRFNHRLFRPNQLKYLRYAHAAGLGAIDPGSIAIREERI